MAKQPKKRIVKIDDDVCTAFQQIMAGFLDGMPELTIAPGSREAKIVAECYAGSVKAYVLESFANFLDQAVDEDYETRGPHEKTANRDSDRRD